jgi:hypothetical protein
MTKKQQTILLAVLASVAVMAIAVVAAAVWIFTSLVHNEEMNEGAAVKTFDEVRARFGGITPVVDLRPDGPMLLRRPPDTDPPSELKTLHILRWSLQDETMSRVELPFALLRLRGGLFRVRTEPDETGRSVSMSLQVSDVERYGPTLLVDGSMPDGGRVLVWSD